MHAAETNKASSVKCVKASRVLLWAATGALHTSAGSLVPAPRTPLVCKEVDQP